MSGMVTLLAVLGAVAVVSRLARTLLRLLLRTAEVTTAHGMVEISIRRGDLTTLMERREAERRARRGRRHDLLLGVLWALWLVLPAFTSWTSEAYAVAAPLWLLPSPRLRPTRGLDNPE